MNYSIIASGPRRSFEITFGLSAGYEENSKKYSLADAQLIIHDWFKSRIERNLPFLTGTLLLGEVLYAWPTGDSQIAGLGGEPVGVYRGEVSVLYNPNITEEELKEALMELGI
jgi:hypothetical protein